MTDRRALVQELRWLVSFATAAGADPARIAAVSGELVELLLDSSDPRARKALDLAQRVHAAHEAGVSIPDLCERFGRSRSQIHRLLRVARLHATGVRFNRSHR